MLRVLINSVNIERTLLATDRKAGDDILKRLGGGGVAWTADHMRVTRYPYVSAGYVFHPALIVDELGREVARLSIYRE